MKDEIKSENNENICRICYENNKNDSDMISPCKCKGTMKWVHSRCLEKWLKISKKKICGSCKYTYKMKKISEYPKFEFINSNKIKKYIAFSVLSIFLFISSYISYNFLGKKKFHNSNILYFFDGLKLLTFISFFIIAVFHYFNLYNIDSILDNLSHYNGINSIYDILHILYQILYNILSQSIEKKLNYRYIVDNYVL